MGMFERSYGTSFAEKTITELWFAKVAFEQNFHGLPTLNQEMLSFIDLTKSTFSNQFAKEILLPNRLTRKWTLLRVKDVCILEGKELLWQQLSDDVTNPLDDVQPGCIRIRPLGHRRSVGWK